MDECVFCSRNCIIDKNAMIGQNVVIANTDVSFVWSGVIIQNSFDC